MRTTTILLALASAVALAGCATTPPPPLSAPVSARAVAGAEKPFPAAWWTVFQDAELDRLMALAREKNRDLEQALARIDEARAQAALAGVEGALQVSGVLGAGRQRISETVGNPQAPGPRNAFSAGLEASYEVDLWGRVRAKREAARKNWELTELERDALELSLLGRVAQAWFEQRAAVREEAVIEQQLAAYRDSISLQRARADAGLASDLELERIRVEQANREGERTAVRLRGQQAAHQLALLCGVPPEALALPGTPAAAHVPEVPDTLAMSLLEARPDVAAARTGWEAARANVERARAAFYPQLQLTGSIGYETADSSSLFDWQSRLASLVAGLTAPLLDGGRLRGELDVERARLRAAAGAYEQAVLTAYREVADAAAAVDALAARAVAAEAGRTASARSLSLARERYSGGFTSYLEVMESERALLAAERSLVQLGAQRQVAAVDLIRALGLP